MSDSNAENFSTITRKLEQFDELHSGGSSFDDGHGEGSESSDHSMEWRRQLLEESYTRIKQAKARTLDPKKIYEVGTLLYDENDNKFGRVLHSQARFLLVEFVSGGTRDYGKAPAGFDRSQVPSLQAHKAAQKRTVRRKNASASAPTSASVSASKNGRRAASASPAKAKSKKAAGAAKTKAASKSRDPGITDVNAYIKENFKTMSNREMARHVGLSEHTIRRKLGEWGLKRAKR